MIYGSVCSGIEAPTRAWHPLGWSPAFFSEIEPFPSAVLAHHYGSNMPDEPVSSNGVPNHGDMSKFEEWPDYAIDLLVGGTPCQDYSIAGLRAGMGGIRGSLTLTYAAIARRYRPRWLVWENVPGVLSINGGRDFASFLGLLSGQRIEVPRNGWRNAGVVPGYHRAYGLAWRVLDAQYVRVDGYGRAVPQRRRRVFVVGYLGDWRRAAAVLFEPESMRGDSAPSRRSGERVAPTISSRPTGGGGLGTDFDLDGGLIAFGGANCSGPIDVSTAVNAHPGRFDFESDTFVAEVAATLPAGGNATGGNRQPGMGAETAGSMLVAHALRSDATRSGEAKRPSIDANGVLRLRNAGFNVYEEHAPTLDTDAPPTVAWSIMPQNSGKDFKARKVDVAQPLMAGGPVGGNQGGDYIQQDWRVRRVLPVECERLQGFPDDFTAVPYRGKPAADGPRYKALGNSMAVNVMRWIGRRIELVESVRAAA